MKWLFLINFCFCLFCSSPLEATQEDPYLWLEEIDGEKALDWVKVQNQAAVAKLEAVPGFEKAYDKILGVLNSDDRIPYAGKYGDYLYNFWRDADHPRGIYRRTTLEEYKKDSPQWELILDIDALAEKEGENWVYSGIDLLYPDYNRGLVNLSRGGADARVVREFDIPSKSFVENGFFLPENKSSIAWKDIDHVYVGTDFGEGSLTTSGYPRIVKVWKRNTPLSEAKTIFEAPAASMTAAGRRFFCEDGNLDFVFHARSFYDVEYFAIENDKLVKMNIPGHVEVRGYFKKQLLLKPRKDWVKGSHTYKAGSILIGDFDAIQTTEGILTVLMEPADRLSIASVNTTRSTILVTVLDKVVNKLYQFTQGEGGKWQRKQVETPDNGALGVFNTTEKSDDYFITYQNFLIPDSLYRVSGKMGELELLKSRPPQFDASPYQVKQHEAVSKDGTRIPYFVVMRKDIQFNGKNPTVLYGYGGFMVSMGPRYVGAKGEVWLDHGGVYVQANIRGGGEFGPKWHQAALLKNRHKCFEDFIAVAEDLIERKITSPSKLAIQGASNGGLLVGAVFVRRPDLFNAVVCSAPLLDMKRYHKLLAGASWVAEYGDPDQPDMWEYIKTYSPYHNLKEGVEYPMVFFTTSTRDDRVHPGHTRKMAARMIAMGHDLYYYENIEGGHAGAANNQQRAYMSALGYAYLYRQLCEER